MIEGHGDDLYRYGGEVSVNFSTNIHQRVDHSGLLRYLAGRGDIYRNYPEPEPRSIEAMLAGHHGIASENVIVTNGATEAIYLIAHLHERGRSAVSAPTFREYQDACRIFGHDIVFVSDIKEVKDADVVWLCNPNNPTGQVYDRRHLLECADAHVDTLFVVDQAYADYSMREVLTVDDVVSRRNVVMLHSLTKQFAVPGLRIGYAVASADVADSMRALRMPWSVNSVAIEAAKYLLDHRGDYGIDAGTLHGEALRMSAALMEAGVEVVPTDCNFFLAVLPDRSAAELKEWLVSRHGLLIRDASNFEGLSSRHFRVAAQGSDENDRLINALREWMAL